MGTDPDETDLSVRAAGRRIAGFELIRRIDTDSNNAFGEVWLATRLQPFQRVAIKFLRRDRVNEEMVERFSRAESKALARFNHPYIARFYELGFHGPVPYLVMQYVPGDRITAYADAHGLSVPERLRLMAKVCDAVQHVHLQGVVHRDLKPANILVSESRPEAEVAREGAGRARAEEDSSAGRGPIPVLIDFGLAKSSNPDAPLTSAVVSRGGMAGTPAYASPEQISARNPEDTGQPADIYALGAVLFELATGVSPMEHVLSDTTLSDPERLARLAKDDRPSMAEAYARLPPQRQEAIARARGIGVPEMRALLRSRLAHLTDRALRQDPKSRFSDARAFALDIGNYLAERDYLEAAAEPRAEKWRRAVRRNRGVFAAVGAVVLALVAGFGTAVWKAREAADARDAFASVNASLIGAQRKMIEVVIDARWPGQFESAEEQALAQQAALLRISLRVAGERPSGDLSEDQIDLWAWSEETLAEICWNRDGPHLSDPSVCVELLRSAVRRREQQYERSSSREHARRLAVTCAALANTVHEMWGAGTLPADSAVGLREALELCERAAELIGLDSDSEHYADLAQKIERLQGSLVGAMRRAN